MKKITLFAFLLSAILSSTAQEELFRTGNNIDAPPTSNRGTFPSPYCGPLDFTIDVEPITLVSVADINNVTDAAVDGTPGHEDFTTIVGNMEPGVDYNIALEGNTGGPFTNRFIVFIDWNQNDVLNDAGEIYEITQTIMGSTGTDGIQATGVISVPADALLGETRMRVKKIFGTTNFMDPCLGAGFGQAEDYTISVGGAFPAPYCGPLDFTFDVEPITLVSVADINNVSDAAVNGSPSHEDFTSIVGNMELGVDYGIALEGNTGGGFTNRFIVFIDWNQNDVLNDAGEVYEITETIIGSTGTDGQQATGIISVPEDALLGETRMRVKKIFGLTNFMDPCLGTGFGQAEDYTISVTEVACEAAENFMVSNVLDTTADMTWDEAPTANDGYQAAVFLQGADPTVAAPVYVSAVLAQTTTSDTATGLSAEIAYDAYLFTICDLSATPPLFELSGPITFNTILNTTVFETDTLAMYPNPTNGMVTLRANVSIETLEVYNILGQVVINRAPNVSEITLDVSSLQSGTYFVKATAEGVTTTQKLIKR